MTLVGIINPGSCGPGSNIQNTFSILLLRIHSAYSKPRRQTSLYDEHPCKKIE